MSSMIERLETLQNEINKVIKGKKEIVEKTVAAVIAGGHILMEDIPGVGKTTLATAAAKALSLDYTRIQFTPDVMPGDILGASIFNMQTREFEFRAGPVFCNLLLADEINRTSPKTQSALLEVMEEGNVTVEGNTWKLEEPFIVIATQNPYGSSGTQRLPESQLDRFMICLSIGYPSREDAIELLRDGGRAQLEEVTPVMDKQELLQIRRQVEEVFVHDRLYEYIVDLAESTRGEEFSLGASPRGMLALLRMAKAMAVLDGRDYAAVSDVQEVFYDVMGHRVRGRRGKAALQEVLQAVRVPRRI